MKNKFSKPLFGLILLSIVIACKKPASVPTKEMIDPKYEGYVPTAEGTPTGTPIQQTIGAEGGTLELPSGDISIEIPEGALDKATTISIQPVTNTLGKLGLGSSFKILPEGIKFKKDVRIVFDYDQAILHGTEAKYLSLAYQDEKGYWHRVADVDHMQSARLISAETKHFSSWTIMTAFKIESSWDRLLKGQTAQLSVTVMDPPIKEDEDLLRPPLSLSAANNGGWTTEMGELTNTNTFTPTFKATDDVTRETHTLIQLNLKGVYDPTVRKTTDVTLDYGLILMPDEYMRVKYDDNLYYINILGVRTTSAKTENIQIIAVDDIHNITIYVYGLQTLSPFSAYRKPGNSTITFNAGRLGRYQTDYFKCKDIEASSQPGDVVMVTNDHKAGGYRVGQFKGKITRPNWCLSTETIPIEGEFRVKIPHDQSPSIKK